MFCLLLKPLMLIVPDVEDVYTPLQTDVIVQLSEVSSRLLVLHAFFCSYIVEVNVLSDEWTCSCFEKF